MSHTPGPWVIERHENPNISAWLLTAPALGTDRDDWNTAAIIGVPLADANLIAAAPELLQSLRYLAEQFIEVSSGDWATHPAWLQAARVIAKAEGHAQ